jgi:hypothetical protein
MCGKWILAHICYAFGFAPRTGCDICAPGAGPDQSARPYPKPLTTLAHLSVRARPQI